MSYEIKTPKEDLDFILRWAEDEEAGNGQWDDYWSQKFPHFEEKLAVARARRRQELRTGKVV